MERVGDLAGVAKVVVEDQWNERHRRRAASAENTLTFIGEDVKATGFVVLQGRQQRIPSGVGGILRLADDDRVEPVAEPSGGMAFGSATTGFGGGAESSKPVR